MTIRIRRNTLDDGLKNFDENIVKAIHTVLDYYGTIAMNEMKQNARWTDRTGNARAGLLTKTFPRDDGGSLLLYSAMPYGIWLEVRWSGKYAIVGPIRDSIAPRVMSTLTQAIQRASQL